MDYFQQLINEVTILSPSIGAIIAGIMACLLLFVSGFASGSEIAFFSLNPNDLSELEEERDEADTKVQQLRQESERTLATILITNNLVNVTIIMLFGYFFDHLVGLCRTACLALLSQCSRRHSVLSSTVLSLCQHRDEFRPIGR